MCLTVSTFAVCPQKSIPVWWMWNNGRDFSLYWWRSLLPLRWEVNLVNFMLQRVNFRL